MKQKLVYRARLLNKLLIITLLLSTSSLQPVNAGTIDEVYRAATPFSPYYGPIYKLNDNYIFYYSFYHKEFTFLDTSDPRMGAITSINQSIPNVQHTSVLYGYQNNLYLISSDSDLRIHNADPDNLEQTLILPDPRFKDTNKMIQHQNYLYLSHKGFYTIVNVTTPITTRILETNKIGTSTNTYTTICGVSDDGNTLFLARETLNATTAGSDFFLTAIDVSNKTNTRIISNLRLDEENPDIGYHIRCSTKHGKLLIGYTNSVQTFDVINSENMILAKTSPFLDLANQIDIYWPFAFIITDDSLHSINLEDDYKETREKDFDFNVLTGVFQDGGNISAGLVVFANGLVPGEKITTFKINGYLMRFPFADYVKPDQSIISSLSNDNDFLNSSQFRIITLIVVAAIILVYLKRIRR